MTPNLDASNAFWWAMALIIAVLALGYLLSGGLR